MSDCVRKSSYRKKLSWRTCPKCMSRATKIMAMETGNLTCQVCEHEYPFPTVDQDRQATPALHGDATRPD